MTPMQKFIKACLALAISTVLLTSTKANQVSKGLPMFTEKRPFECFERVKVTTGGTTELRCAVDGYPKPNITWTRFGEIVGNTDNVNVTDWSVVLKDITREECGLYECSVCNEHGCVTFEYLVEMDDHAKDIVTFGAWHQQVCYGINGKNVKWTKNTHSRSCFASITDKHNSEMPDPDENDNLIFERTTYADAGLYICTNGSEHYLRELIVVNNKFENEPHLDHYFIMKSSGSSVTLKCGSNGANVSWSKNKKIQNITNSAIKIENITRNDGGLYRCLVCYDVVCRAHQFLLIIDTVFSGKSMLNSTKNTNGDKWPYCGSVLSDFNVDYSIDYVSGQISDGNYTQLVNNPTLSNNSDMKPVCENNGWCTCIVTSIYGKHFKSAFLQPALPNAAQFESVQAIEMMFQHVRETLELSCDAKGIPKPNITWTYDGKPQKQTARVVLTSSRLQIENLTKADSGEYSCKICNLHGCTKRTYAILVSRRKDWEKRIITATLNSSTTLECLDQYYSFVQKIVWTKNKEILTPLPDTLQYVKNFNVQRFRSIQPSDEGAYLCNISFRSGKSIGKIFHLNVNRLSKNMTTQPDMSSVIMIPAGIFICTCVAIPVLFIICRKFMKRSLANEQNEVTASNLSLENGYETIGISVLPTSKIQQQRHSTSSRISAFSDPDYDIPTDIRWEFPRDKLELGSILAQGTFGKVVQAEARGIVPGSSTTTTVAVKMLKLRHTDDDVEDFIRELDIMKMIGKHPNIVNLLGCCSANGPLYIITEYAPYGNLKHFLQEHRPGETNTSSGTINESCSLSVNQLTDFAYQIAKGMDYLASRKCVHRDLAARNILVSNDYVMKIADFGLARDVHAEELYHKVTAGKLPIRWMAPESLEYRLFTTQSDVWSYGVLIWEIMTFGEQPYKDWNNIHDQLEKGMRMEQPELCPDEVYQLMTGCWQLHAAMRPTFSEIAQSLKKLAVESCDDEYEEVYYTPEMESK